MRTTRALPTSALASAAAAAAAATLVLLIVVGCAGKPEVADAKPLRRHLNGVDVWVDRSPPYKFSVMTTEDVSLNLDELGKRDFRMRGDAAVTDAAVARAKAIGADAVVMTTEPDRRAADGREVPRRLMRMTMFVRYDERPPAAPTTGPTTAPTTP